MALVQATMLFIFLLITVGKLPTERGGKKNFKGKKKKKELYPLDSLHYAVLIHKHVWNVLQTENKRSHSVCRQIMKNTSEAKNTLRFACASCNVH